MRKILIIACLSLIFLQVWASDAWDLFRTDRIDDTLKSGWWDLVQTADNLLGYLIGLLYFIAVALWIYGWFTILVSGWDEEKVKKWKNIIIYVVIGLIVIFLASQLINWVIDVIWSEDIVWPNTNN
jgi:tetrahydromethanopterin S-methyltransferase subunit G